ncbi:hypothetical protein TEQG_00014 [Trichophyton equinum CBS 127.97]|uniref:Uncharacterized protein n=1 Tax=Trichophyton equinum (strain ATCC MYA-4606 / CBS 127.97) TaxID=559882 RepID=F2PGE1_TRIEC|nr:hypothetical protein TEQG_00014 [Trichophyton equinum CBS 127.97]
MESHTGLNAEILDTLLGHKNQISTKLHTIIKVLKPDLSQEHIYLPEDKLLKYGIRKETMDLEQGGRFFKPMSQSVFENLPRLEEYYEEDGWDRYNKWESTDDEIYDASHILVKLERFIGGEIPNTPTDKWGCHRVLTDYAEWDFAHLDHTLCGGHWGSTGPGREPTDWRFERAFDRHARGTYLQPHVISLSVHGLYPDEDTNLKIARSEVLVAADFMKERLKCPLYVTNDLYPILMVSCFNRQVRMNEVYFENGTLCFNCTPFINFDTFERSKLDLLARWALSTPIGETSKYPNIKPIAKHLNSFLKERNHRNESKCKTLSKSSEMPVSKRIKELRRS